MGRFATKWPVTTSKEILNHVNGPGRSYKLTESVSVCHCMKKIEFNPYKGTRDATKNGKYTTLFILTNISHNLNNARLPNKHLREVIEYST